MHPNPAFRNEPLDRNLSFARERGFGVLAVSMDGPPLMAHVPFLLAEDGKSAELHLVRSNPIVAAMSEPRLAQLAVSGPDSYVSPDWYGLPDQVPTWNYVAVHLTGRLVRLEQAALRGILDRLSQHFETRLAPKPAWTADKMEPDALARLMRMIVPCRLEIEDVAGTWKLGQNKPAEARVAAADALEAVDIGADAASLARLMRKS